MLSPIGYAGSYDLVDAVSLAKFTNSNYISDNFAALGADLATAEM